MKNQSNEKYFKAGVTIVASAAVCLVMTYTVFNMGNVVSRLSALGAIIAPFVYGAVIAYLLAPLCNKLENILGRDKPVAELGRVTKAMAIAIAMAIALAVVTALIILVIPQVTSSALIVINTLPEQMEAFKVLLHDMLESNPDLQSGWDALAAFAIEQVNEFYSGDVIAMVQKVLNGVGDRVVSAIDFVKNIAFGLLISVYMLASRRRFASQSKLILYSIAPDKWAQLIEGEVRFADKMFNGFLVGKILDSTIIGVLCFIGCLIFKIQTAAFISVMVGVFNIIPFFGPIMAAVFCGLLLLLQSPVSCLTFLIFFLVLQQFDGNILGPKIIGNTTGLSGFWVLFSILLFGGMWGVVGMVVGIPLFAVIYDIVRRLVDFGLMKKGREDLLGEYRVVYPDVTASVPVEEIKPDAKIEPEGEQIQM